MASIQLIGLRQTLRSLQQLKLCKLLSLAVLCLGVLAVSDELCAAEPPAKPLEMNGVAAFAELGEEQFLGAFFTDHPGAPAITQLVTSRDMRMEFKVVNAKGFSKRRLDQLWQEGLAINSSQEQLAAKAEAIASFIDMVKGNLELGDHLVIESRGGRDLYLWLNEVQLGHIRDDQLFNMLLATWIGRVSLSSEFRSGLLNFTQMDRSLSERYLHLLPAPGREVVVRTWRQQARQQLKDTAGTGLAQQG